jgi:hypothetical protein
MAISVHCHQQQQYGANARFSDRNSINDIKGRTMDVHGDRSLKSTQFLINIF